MTGSEQSGVILGIDGLFQVVAHSGDGTAGAFLQQSLDGLPAFFLGRFQFFQTHPGLLGALGGIQI
ncbi:hypothetical protein, partial [Thiolapillus sp.]|uniref:hypothetical protein n=1 Tax=Thiolapillus sp. TaxID=2017437 RepID=UPI003AF75CB1